MVQDAGSVALLPSQTTVSTEDCPLARRLYLYVPTGALLVARDFVDFALSEDGPEGGARDRLRGPSAGLRPRRPLRDLRTMFATRAGSRSTSGSSATRRSSTREAFMTSRASCG
jgi:hypothetical protein